MVASSFSAGVLILFLLCDKGLSINDVRRKWGRCVDKVGTPH